MVDRLRPHSVRSPGSPAPWAPENEAAISDLIEFGDVVTLTGTVLIGTITAGARYLSSTVDVITAFNAGADDALVVGIATDTNLLVLDGHPTAADSQTEGELLNWTPTADQLIYATYTHTGTPPTTGQAVVTIRFKQPL